MLVRFKRIRLLSAELLSYVDICHYYCNFNWQTDRTFNVEFPPFGEDIHERGHTKEGKQHMMKVKHFLDQKRSFLCFEIFLHISILLHIRTFLYACAFFVLSYFCKEFMYFYLFPGKCAFECFHLCVFVYALVFVYFCFYLCICLCSSLCVFLYALVFVYFCFQLAAGGEDIGAGVHLPGGSCCALIHCF